MWENQRLKFKLSFSKTSTTLFNSVSEYDNVILKLEAYGLSKSALNLMYSYLSERKQCVKVGVDFSAWKNIYKGVPQGSILGPVWICFHLVVGKPMD
jgi:hypothetical protein